MAMLFLGVLSGAMFAAGILLIVAGDDWHAGRQQRLIRRMHEERKRMARGG
jgi:hypothetical protein